MRVAFFSFRKSIGRKNPTRRQHPRKQWMQQAGWDFFTGATGMKPCLIENLSTGGCLLRSSEPIQNRRWVRLVLEDQRAQLSRTVVGWVVRLESSIQDELPLVQECRSRNEVNYRYGVQFLHNASRVLVLD